MSSWRFTLPLFLLAFAPTLVWMWQGWFLEYGYFGHGPLMVLAALWFLLERRRRLAATPRRPARMALPVLAGCLLVHVAGQALMVDGLSGLAFVPALLCLVWAQEGGPRWRLAAPPIGCLLFAVPLPIFVTGKIAYGMKHFATAAAVELGNLVGLGLSQDGASIVIPGQEQPLLVGDACSGLRSLVALTALGWIYAFFLTPRRPLGRALFLALSVPIALFANFLRITVLAAIASFEGVAFAAGPAHDVSGWALYLAAIGMLFGLDRLLPGRCPRSEMPRGATGADEGRAGPGAAIVVGACGLPALLLAVWVPSADQERFASRMPRESAGFVATVDHAMPERFYALLGTRDVCWRNYRDRETQALVTMTAIFQGSRWKSLHPPEVCLIASGFEIANEERCRLDIASGPVELSVLAVDNRTSRYLVGYAFGGVDYTTPSFLGFFAHNAPRALFRRSTRGFMLRVDAAWPPTRSRAEVEGLLGKFFADFLPVTQSLLRQ